MTLTVNKLVFLAFVWGLFIMVSSTLQAAEQVPEQRALNHPEVFDLDAHRELDAEMQRGEEYVRSNVFIGIAGLLIVIAGAWSAEPWISRRWRYRADAADDAYQRICDLDDWLQKLAREIDIRRAWEERFSQRLYSGVRKLTSFCMRLEKGHGGEKMTGLRELIDKLKMQSDIL